MHGVVVGCGQITWENKCTEDQILREIARAGYEGAPAGPQNDRTAAATVEMYGRHGLRPAPGYFSAEFWREDRRDEILRAATQQARYTRELGCTELFVAARGFDYMTRGGKARRELAGQVRAEDGLADAEWDQLTSTLNAVAAITLDHGVRSCFHNHVGTVIETHAEMDRLLSFTDPDLLFLGPDTGHLAWAGADVLAFYREYASRIRTMHLKDVHDSVVTDGRDDSWDYGMFTGNGVFAELGEGCVDFPALFGVLEEAGFTGWVIAETDVTQKATALESATVSRRYLQSIGV